MIDVTTPGLLFDAGRHSYTMDGRRMVSVTSLVKRFSEPFDAAKWSKLKARERGVTPDVIQAEWAAKAEHGSAVHEAAVALARDGVAPECHDGYGDALRAFWADYRPEPIAAECLVAWPEAGVAGTIDLIARVGSLVAILDYKTSDNLYFGSPRKRMYAPVAHLESGNWSDAALQLSLYRRVWTACYEDRYGVTVERLVMVQLSPTGYTVRPMVYLEPETDDILSTLQEETAA